MQDFQKPTSQISTLFHHYNPQSSSQEVSSVTLQARFALFLKFSVLLATTALGTPSPACLTCHISFTRYPQFKAKTPLFSFQGPVNSANCHLYHRKEAPDFHLIMIRRRKFSAGAGGPAHPHAPNAVRCTGDNRR